MMTTLAAILGALPIAIGVGAGSELRQPLGLVVVGGLILSQLLTLYITPVIFIYLELARRYFFPDKPVKSGTEPRPCPRRCRLSKRPVGGAIKPGRITRNYKFVHHPATSPRAYPFYNRSARRSRGFQWRHGDDHKFRSIEGAAALPARPLQVRAQPSGGRERRRPACRRRDRRVRLYRSNRHGGTGPGPAAEIRLAGLQRARATRQAGGNLRAGGNRSRLPDGAERRGAAGTAGAVPGRKPFKGTPFEHFFDQFKNGHQGFGSPDGGQGPAERVKALGSGFFISADGYAVTNNHVVDGASKIEIVTDSGKTHRAKVVGTDAKTDLALIKVEGGNDFPFVKMAPSMPKIGEWVIAVGNPYGLGGTVTAGIVSAENRDIGSGPYDDFIQIDAAVNRGNSGGPTFNLDGEVIGVNTAIFSPSGGSVGIAFDIPTTTVQAVIPDTAGTRAIWSAPGSAFRSSR